MNFICKEMGTEYKYYKKIITIYCKLSVFYVRKARPCYA